MIILQIGNTISIILAYNLEFAVLSCTPKVHVFYKYVWKIFDYISTDIPLTYLIKENDKNQANLTSIRSANSHYFCQNDKNKCYSVLLPTLPFLSMFQYTWKTGWSLHHDTAFVSLTPLPTCVDTAEYSFPFSISIK